MRILLSSDHQYPSFREVGVGRRPLPIPSGSSQHIHDLIAKGLAELGHEVLYWLPKGTHQALPPGVTLVTEREALVFPPTRERAQRTDTEERAISISYSFT